MPACLFVLLAAASFGAPAFSAEETRICCFVPDYHSNLPVPNYSQPVPNYRQPVPNYSQPVPNYRRAVVPNYRRRLPYWVPGHWVIGPHGGQQWFLATGVRAVVESLKKAPLHIATANSAMLYDPRRVDRRPLRVGPMLGLAHGGEYSSGKAGGLAGPRSGRTLTLWPGHWHVTVKRRTVFPGQPCGEPYVKKT